MAPNFSAVQRRPLQTSFTSPNFFNDNYSIYDTVSNANNIKPNENEQRFKLNLLTFNVSETNRIERLRIPQIANLYRSKERLMKEMKFRGRTNTTNEHSTSTESLLQQQCSGPDNYQCATFTGSHGSIRRIKTEVVLLDKLDYEYKREQKSLLELKDKISEVEEEYNEILNKQKEKEKRLKERIQKLKSRFQIVIKIQSYFVKAAKSKHEEQTEH